MGNTQSVSLFIHGTDVNLKKDVSYKNFMWIKHPHVKNTVNIKTKFSRLFIHSWGIQLLKQERKLSGYF
jgi:hypothetical protein